MHVMRKFQHSECGITKQWINKRPRKSRIGTSHWKQAPEDSDPDERTTGHASHLEKSPFIYLSGCDIMKLNIYLCQCGDLLPFHRYIAPSTHTLGKPKDSFKVFCKIIRESAKELFGQLNNYIWLWGPRFRNPAPPCTQVRAIARFYLALGLEREGGRGPEGG